MSASAELATRNLIVDEAISWIGTPYRSNGLVKGRQGGGTDCAMLLLGVYRNVGLLPSDLDPRPYPAQWHLHKTEEKYMEALLSYSHEIPGPPLPGDIVMFKIGKVFAHGAIVINWPLVVHAIGNSFVLREDISKCNTGKRALNVVPRKFFSLWEPKSE